MKWILGARVEKERKRERGGGGGAFLAFRLSVSVFPSQREMPVCPEQRERCISAEKHPSVF